MAKREEAVNMTAQFAEFKELKDIDKTTLTVRWARSTPARLTLPSLAVVPS